MKIYILKRKDDYYYDEYTEVSVVAKNEERVLEMAREKLRGRWYVDEEANLDKEKMLTANFYRG